MSLVAEGERRSQLTPNLPYRSRSRLMHNYRPDHSSAHLDTTTSQKADNASVSQTDLYASYVARFGGDLTGTNEDEAEDQAGPEDDPKAGTGSMEIEESSTLATGTRLRSMSEAMEPNNVNRVDEVKSGKCETSQPVLFVCF